MINIMTDISSNIDNNILLPDYFNNNESLILPPPSPSSPLDPNSNILPPPPPPSSHEQSVVTDISDNINIFDISSILISLGIDITRCPPLGKIETPEIDKWKEVKLYDKDFRIELKDMADTISRLDLWDWVWCRLPPPPTEINNKNIIYWQHKNKKKIYNNINCKIHTDITFHFAF